MESSKEKIKHQKQNHRYGDISNVKPLASGSAQNRPWTSKLIRHVASVFSAITWEIPALFTSRSPLISGEYTSQGLQKSGDYTVCHLQGGLQLADVLIRKVTGKHYQLSVAVVNPLDEVEARLQASLQQWAGFSGWPSGGETTI